MFQEFLLFFTVSFLCASTVSASTVQIDETVLAENKMWSSDIPPKEDKKENEKTFSLGTHGHYDRGYEWKEEYPFDLDHDDRQHHRFRDCEQPSPIPIPGSLLLFVSGVAGLIGLIKHRTK